METPVSVNDDQTLEMFYQSPAQPPDSRDLETIVTLMELASIFLTPHPDATFTSDGLFAKMVECGGPTITLHRVDFDIVLPRSGFLTRLSGGRWKLT